MSDHDHDRELIGMLAGAVERREAITVYGVRYVPAPPWPEAVMPDLADVVRHLQSCDPAEAAVFVVRSRKAGEEATRCFIERHDALREELQAAYERLNAQEDALVRAAALVSDG